MTGQDGSDWVETLTRIAASLGFNPVRVRWKLTRWRQRLTRTERVAEQKVHHIQYEHKVCSSCGRVNDRYAAKCVGCGERMSSRSWQVFERVGVTMPDLLSVSSLLGLAMIGIYAFLMVKHPGQGYTGWSAAVLVGRGANWWPATHDGQWWRLGTYVFLHIGLVHIAFNLIALAQTGPLVEKAFGRGRMLFFFVLTGVVGGVASLLLTPGGFSAGASGAVMGLIGVGAGWGHRDGTTIGREVRNQMIKWALYTMAFGLIVNMRGGFGFRVDNAAHGAGLVTGAALGYLTPPSWVRRKTSIRLGSVLMGGVGAAAAIASVVLVLMPPRSSRKWVEATSPAGTKALGYALIDQACTLRDQGQRQRAEKKLAEMAKFGLMLSGGEDSTEDPLDGACAHASALRAMCALEPPTPADAYAPADGVNGGADAADEVGERQEACAAIRLADSWKAKGY